MGWSNTLMIYAILGGYAPFYQDYIPLYNTSYNHLGKSLIKKKMSVKILLKWRVYFFEWKANITYVKKKAIMQIPVKCNKIFHRILKF